MLSRRHVPKEDNDPEHDGLRSSPSLSGPAANQSYIARNSAETNEAIRLLARLEGMMTDPVYEGKSMQGLISLVRKGFFPARSKILYAHLGGVPAINGYSYICRNG